MFLLDILKLLQWTRIKNRSKNHLHMNPLWEDLAEYINLLEVFSSIALFALTYTGQPEYISKAVQVENFVMWELAM